MNKSKRIVFLCIICSVAIVVAVGTIFLTRQRGDCEHREIVKVEAQSASCTDKGKMAHYQCMECYSLFADAELKTPLEPSATFIDAPGHDWVEATCNDPKSCKRCSATEGSALGHDWTAATCNDPKSCKRCSATEGSVLGHDWTAATCDDPKSCKRCPATEGSALGHDWTAATCDDPKSCKRCPTTEGSALGHDWTAATCDDPKSCKRCPATEGSALGHDWMAATCDDPKSCKRCPATEGSALGHDWAAATCDDPKSCKRCPATEGSALGHDWAAATCDDPKSCKRCPATEGTALGHDWDEQNAIWEWIILDDTALCELILTCTRDGNHQERLTAAVSKLVQTPPTCQSSGLAIFKASVTVDNVIHQTENEVVLDAIEHTFDFENAVFKWTADYSEVLVHIPCTQGGHIENYLATVTKIVEPATCTDDGAEVYTALVEVLDVELFDVKTVPILAKGHSYVLLDTEWNQGGTDLVSAKFIFECENNCNHTAECIAFATCNTVKPAGCILAGEMLCTATVTYEGEIYEQSTVLPIAAPGGHSFHAGVCQRCGKPEHSEGLSFEETADGNGYILTGIGDYTGSVLSVPDQYNGKPVVAIGENAFKSNETLTAVYLPDHLQTVGKYAFAFCGQIKSLYLGGSVTIIESYAFNSCQSLEALHLPDSVERIKQRAFEGCSAVKTLTLGKGLKILEEYAFSYMPYVCEVALPDSLTEIGDYAFSRFESLTNITLPASLTYLSPSAFYDSYKLVEIKNLSAMSISANVQNGFFLKNVYSDASGESKLRTDQNGFVFYVDGNEVYLLAYRGEGDVILPDSYSGKNYGIWHYAFSNTNFESGYLFLPDAVISIGGYAFARNKTLRVLAGGEGVRTIDTYAFSNCTELLSVTLGTNLTTIANYAFDGCIRLMDVVNRSTLAVSNSGVAALKFGSVALHAFKVHNGAQQPHVILDESGYAWYMDSEVCLLVRYFGKATQLRLPEKHLNYSYDIYSYCFDNTNLLEMIEISPATAILYEYAFSNCDTLASFTVWGTYKSLKEIRSYALSSTSIISLELPDSLVYIGEYAMPSTLQVVRISDTEEWYQSKNGGSGLKVSNRFYTDTAAYLLEKEDFAFFKKVQ